MPYDIEAKRPQARPQEDTLAAMTVQDAHVAENWGLTLPDGAWGFDESAPIEGRKLICNRKSLGRIKTVFAEFGAVETFEGNVFVLGKPDRMFGAMHPGLMTLLGK